MTEPVIETSLTKPYIEVLIPGPQGAAGNDGAEFLVYTGSAYPTRESAERQAIFVGPVDPDTLLLAGDSWVDTSGDAPVTSVNGEVGVVVLDAADVGALADDYVPAYGDLTGAPDFQSQINNKLDTVSAAELIRDTMGVALVEGTGVTITVNDVANTITIDSDGSGGGAVDSVNGQTGVVVLSAGDVTAVPTARTVNGHALTGNVTVSKADVGLSSADNTADATKAVLSATKLATARTINGQAFDGTANITVPVTASFLLSGNVAGQMVAQDLVAGGVYIPVNATIDKIMLRLDLEPRGTDSLIIQAVKRVRTTGVETVLGTGTFVAGARRVTITGLAASFVVGDSLILRCTQVGDVQAGSDLAFVLSDSLATSFPTALTAPAAPTSFTAIASGADVALAWTAPASGTYYAVDVWKDEAFLTRVLKGTNGFLDVNSADDAHSYKLYAVNNDITSAVVTASYTATSGLGNPVYLGSGVTNTTGLVVTMQVTAPVSAGDCVILSLAGTVPTGMTEVWTVTDARGNTWATNVHAYDNTSSQQSMIASTRVTTNLQTNDVITVTGTNATARLVIQAFSVSGIAASGRLDKTQVNTPSTSTRNLSTNATAALAQANEIVFSTFSALSNSQPVTAGASWAIGTIAATTAGSNDRMVITEWRIVNSTSAVTGTATLNTSSAYAGAIASYKG